jgi:hypothetical protein
VSPGRRDAKRRDVGGRNPSPSYLRRYNPKKPRPFGGIQLIVLGDFEMPHTNASISKSGKNLFTFQDPTWTIFNFRPTTIDAAVPTGSTATSLKLPDFGLFSESALTPRHKMNRNMVNHPYILGEPIIIRSSLVNKDGDAANDTIDLSGRSLGDGVVKILR